MQSGAAASSARRGRSTPTGWKSRTYRLAVAIPDGLVTPVKRLRDKLRTAGRFIQSVRGMGYRFSENTAGAQRRRKGLAAPHVHSVPVPLAVARP